MSKASSVTVSTWLLKETTTVTTDTFCVWTVLNGSGELKTHLGTFSIGMPDVFSMNPREDATIYPTEDLVLMQLDIDDELMTDAFGHNFVTIYCNSALGMDCKDVHKFLLKIGQLYYANVKDNCTLLLKAAAYELLHLLKNNYSGAVSGEPSVSADQYDRRYQIAQYLSLHYKEQLTLSDVAEHFSLTPQYFSKYFSRTFGKTFLAYLRDLRLTDAIKALEQGGKSITAVALDAGFPNIASFNKAFQQQLHVSPREYAAQQAGNADNIPSSSLQEISAPEQISAYYDVSASIEPNIEFRKADDAIRLSASASVLEAAVIKDTWRDIINVGAAEQCMDSIFQQQFRDMIPFLGFRYVRISNIFSPAIFPSGYSSDSVGFQHLDRLVNFFLSAGCKPMFEIGPAPIKQVTSARSHCVSNLPEEQRAPENFISIFLKHCIEYWGIQEVSTWRFESWCPQIMGRTMLENSEIRFSKSFAYIYRRIKAISPQIQVGCMGISVNLQTPEVAEKTLERLKNYYNVTPDFISLHAYPDCVGNMDETSFESSISALLGTEISSYHDRIHFWTDTIHAIYPKMRILLTEYGSDNTHRLSVNDCSNKAAFITDFTIHEFDAVSGMGYCYFSDLNFEPQDAGASAPLYGGNGLISKDGLRKSGFYACYFLNKLGSHLVARGDHYIATSSAGSHYEVLVHNHKELSSSYCTEYFKDTSGTIHDSYFQDLRRLEFSLTLNNLRKGTYRVKRFTLNPQNDLRHGMRAMNASYMLHEEEIQYLKDTCVPSQYLEYDECTTSLTLNAVLEPDEVTLFIISLYSI